MTLSDGLVGHWTMDDIDTEGATLKDRSGQDNHGTVAGGVTTGAPGVVGESYDFDGTNGYVQTANVIDSDVGSVSLLLTPQAIQSSEVALLQSNVPTNAFGGSDEIGLEISSGSARFTYYTSDNRPSLSTSINSGETVHLTLTWENSNQIQLYKDGTLTGQKDVPEQAFRWDSPTDLFLGTVTNSNERFFTGRISDVRVYDRVLSADEARALSNMRSPRRQTMNLSKDLVLHLPADETHYRNGEHRDRGGYDYHGTASTPEFTDGPIYSTAAKSVGENMGIPFDGPMGGVFSGYELTVALWWKQTANTSKDWTDFIKYRSPSESQDSRLERGNTGQNPEWSDYWTTLGVQRDDPVSTSNCGVPREEWFHLTMRRFEGGYEVYVNGELDQSISVDYPIPEPDLNDSLIVDAVATELFYQDVRVYDRALSSVEINQLADMRRPREVIA